MMRSIIGRFWVDLQVISPPLREWDGNSTSVRLTLRDDHGATYRLSGIPTTIDVEGASDGVTYHPFEVNQVYLTTFQIAADYLEERGHMEASKLLRAAQ